jgi:hypothetical protein
MCDAVRVTTLEDNMNRWKTMAMMSMGFACGVVWTAACGGTDSAKADDSGYEDDGSGSAGSSSGDCAPPPPSSHGGARTVLEIRWNLEGDNCSHYNGRNCCPSGFRLVGYSTPTGGGDEAEHQVCLENAS